MIRIVYWASDGKKRNIEAEDEDDLHRQLCDIETDVTKLKGLFGVLHEMYGLNTKFMPEVVVEAAWKAVPKYTWWRRLLINSRGYFPSRNDKRTR